MATDYLQAMGVGAGFDTKKIVTAIVDAEKAAKQASIDRKTKDVDASVSGILKALTSQSSNQSSNQGAESQ